MQLRHSQYLKDNGLLLLNKYTKDFFIIFIYVEMIIIPSRRKKTTVIDLFDIGFLYNVLLFFYFKHKINCQPSNYKNIEI